MSDPTPRPVDDPAAEEPGSGYRSRSPKVAFVVAAVAAVVAIVALVIPSTGEPDEPAADASAPPSDSQVAASEEEQQMYDALATLARRDPTDPLARGAVDAPVVMIEYSDFQCPYCGRHARETAPELIERYVDQGVLRIEWRDFPYLGEESLTAAVAARAAGEQGRFWEFHQALFTAQESPNSGAIDDEWLTERAREADLDLERFAADLDNEALQEQVSRDAAEGQQIGVSGTPAFLINGRPIIGAQETGVFIHAIEMALAEVS